MYNPLTITPHPGVTLVVFLVAVTNYPIRSNLE